MKEFASITNNEIEMGFINSELVEYENHVRELKDGDRDIVEIYSDLHDILSD